MRNRAMAVVLPFCAWTALAQEPVVQRDAIWTDTVQRSDMAVMVRGLGTVVSAATASVKIPERMAAHVAPGQAVTLKTKEVSVTGTVSAVGAQAENGAVDVTVALQGSPAVPAGAEVDATIAVRTLRNVLHVGRPATLTGNAGELFRIDADGQHATRVEVLYGEPSATMVQIRSGLEAGDHVILSDMSAYEGQRRVRLQ